MWTEKPSKPYYRPQMVSNSRSLNHCGGEGGSGKYDNCEMETESISEKGGFTDMSITVRVRECDAFA